ncbi:uncharacterized protein LOC143586145 [Bidens hawaiensis]|uniref:uncharacterized protein LOC143586145 n=1 Tax=Bidens hawaiensis TaxID=980011 RepID=UPI0040492BD7
MLAGLLETGNLCSCLKQHQLIAGFSASLLFPMPTMAQATSSREKLWYSLINSTHRWLRMVSVFSRWKRYDLTQRVHVKMSGGFPVAVAGGGGGRGRRRRRCRHTNNRIDKKEGDIYLVLFDGVVHEINESCISSGSSE